MKAPGIALRPSAQLRSFFSPFLASSDMEQAACTLPTFGQCVHQASPGCAARLLRCAARQAQHGEQFSPRSIKPDLVVRRRRRVLAKGVHMVISGCSLQHQELQAAHSPL